MDAVTYYIKINEVVAYVHSYLFFTEETKHFPVIGLSSNFQESRYTSDYFVSKYFDFIKALVLRKSTQCPNCKCEFKVQAEEANVSQRRQPNSKAMDRQHTTP